MTHCYFFPFRFLFVIPLAKMFECVELIFFLFIFLRVNYKYEMICLRRMGDDYRIKYESKYVKTILLINNFNTPTITLLLCLVRQPSFKVKQLYFLIFICFVYYFDKYIEFIYKVCKSFRTKYLIFVSCCIEIYMMFEKSPMCTHVLKFGLLTFNMLFQTKNFIFG